MTTQSALKAQAIVTKAEQNNLQAAKMDLGSVGWMQNAHDAETAVEKLGQRFLAMADTHAQAINSEETQDTGSKKRLDNALERIAKYFIYSSLVILVIWFAMILSTWLVPDQEWWHLTLAELRKVSFFVFVIGVMRFAAVCFLGSVFDSAAKERASRLERARRIYVRIAFFRPQMQFVGAALMVLMVAWFGLNAPVLEKVSEPAATTEASTPKPNSETMPAGNGEKSQAPEPSKKAEGPDLTRATYKSALQKLAWALPAIGFGLMAQAYTMLQHSLAQVTTNRRRMGALTSLNDSMNVFEEYRVWLEGQGAPFAGTVKKLAPNTSRQEALKNRMAAIRAKLATRNDRYKQQFDRGSVANVAFVTLFGLLGDVGNLSPSTEKSSTGHLLRWAATGGGQVVNPNGAVSPAEAGTDHSENGSDETPKDGAPDTMTAHADASQGALAGCDYLPVGGDVPQHNGLVNVLSTSTMLDCMVVKYNEHHGQLEALNRTMRQIEVLLEKSDERLIKVVHSIDIEPDRFSELESKLTTVLGLLDRLKDERKIDIDDKALADLLSDLLEANQQLNGLQHPRTPEFNHSNLTALEQDIVRVAGALDRLQDARTPDFNHDEITDLGHSLQFINRQLDRLFVTRSPEFDHLELVDLANSLQFIDRQFERTFEPLKPSIDMNDLNAVKDELAIILKTLDALRGAGGIQLGTTSGSFPPSCTLVAEHRFAHGSAAIREDGDKGYWLTPDDTTRKKKDHIIQALKAAFESKKESGYDNPLLYVLGSADSSGSVQLNALLAEQRAESVARSMNAFPAVILSAGEGRWVTGALPLNAKDPAQRSAQIWLCNESLGRLAQESAEKPR